MKMITVAAKIIFLCALITASPMANAQDVDLLLTHTMKSVGVDGITRTAEFSERVVRRKNQIWTERIMPASAITTPDAARAEKEFDTALASRWIVRRADMKPELMLVNTRAKLVVPIDKPDYDNIGFDGSWDSAYYLLDPKSLKQMYASGSRQADGTAWYESKRGKGATQTTIKVLWDETFMYPRQIESVRADGTDRKKMTATKLAAQRTLPWDSTKNYRHKNYADFLD